MKKEDYYINLLLSKCISLKKTKSVFISYNTFNEGFVSKLVKRLEQLGANDIYLECIDPFYEHELLSKMSLSEIKESKYFDESIYNKYAKKGASFVIFVSPVPGIFSDIDDEKLALVSKIKSTTKKYFVKKETNNEIPWTIVPLYNEYWEKSLGIKNLEKILYKICLIDKHSEENWDRLIKDSLVISTFLNNLKLDYLHYQNKKGTDLKVGLPKDYDFESVGETEVIVNLPSYEIFTSPSKYKTNGIVYSSKPLYYNGTAIEDFYLKFKDGKVIDFDAKKGKEVLRSIIEFDKGSSYLGECALVDINSPISKTGITFKTTLLDENASCHLALGRGFGKGKEINKSDIHVDFMIGTKDLCITGYKDNIPYEIMKDGKFVI